MRGIVLELLSEIATIAARLASVSFLAMTFLFVIAKGLPGAYCGLSAEGRQPPSRVCGLRGTEEGTRTRTRVNRQITLSGRTNKSANLSQVLRTCDNYGAPDSVRMIMKQS